MDSLLPVLKFLSGAATFAVMFGATLRITPEMVRRLRDNPPLFLRTLVAVWIGVPLITGLVILALGVSGHSAALLLLMAVCPGVPLLLRSARTVGGTMATAVVALVLMAATEPVMIPFWTRLLSKWLPMNLTVTPGQVMDVLLPTVFLPIALGFVVRDLSIGTKLLARASDVVYFAGVAVSIVVVLYQGLPLLSQVPPRAIAAAWIITIGDAMLGYWAGAPAIEDRKAVAMAAALGNPALALAVVEASYPGFAAVVLVSVYLVVRGAAIVPLEWVLRRWRKATTLRLQQAGM